MFAFYRSLNAPNAPLTQRLPAAAGEYQIGQALTLSGGVLTKATGTAVPGYISAFAGTAAEGQPIPVTPANGQQFHVPCAADPAALKPGDKVTLHTDSAQVTATTAGGTVLVLDTCGAAQAGDTLLVQL